MNDRLYYVGVTHESAPLGIRENIHPDAEKQREMLARLGELADGRMTLSTCERFEVYATTDRIDSETWVAALARWFHLPSWLLADHVSIQRGSDAAEHLIRVAGGLDSRVVGEPQILGQVRRAFVMAQEARALNPVLHALGRAAIHAGKRIRHETAITSGGSNIAAIALDRLTREAGECAAYPLVRDRRFLIVGSGALAAIVAGELSLRRARNVTILARNAERAALLAARIGAAQRPLGDLSAAIAGADVIVTCTSSPAFLVDASNFDSRRQKPLICFDLSAPRNIDPQVTRIARVRLIGLDDLVESGGAGDPIRFAAERIVRDELDRFLRWRRERSAVPRIVDLLRRWNRFSPQNRAINRRCLHNCILRCKECAA